MKFKKISFAVYFSLISTFSFSEITVNTDLFKYLVESETTSFLVSQNGNLIINEEFKVKKNLNPMNIMFFNLFRHGSIENRSQEDVASVQKSLVSILIGIAQERGVLNINDSVNTHLGRWTQLEETKILPCLLSNSWGSEL